MEPVDRPLELPVIVEAVLDVCWDHVGAIRVRGLRLLLEPVSASATCFRNRLPVLSCHGKLLLETSTGYLEESYFLIVVIFGLP